MDWVSAVLAVVFFLLLTLLLTGILFIMPTVIMFCEGIMEHFRQKRREKQPQAQDQQTTGAENNSGGEQV